MTEHVDKARLETDLFYRFEYLSKFFDFNSYDIECLNRIFIHIHPRLSVFVDTIYRKLFTFDITKQYFFLRHSDFQHTISSNDQYHFSFHCEQLEFRKNMLTEYLKRIFTDQHWNESSVKYLSSVGQIHTSQAGSKIIHVDYFHLNALLGFIAQNLIDLIMKLNEIDEQLKYSSVLAVNKVFWIQNDFFRIHFNKI